MTRVNIDVPPRPYQAVIESGLIDRAGVQLRQIYSHKAPGVFVITVAPVRRRWGKKLMNALMVAGFEARLLEMPDGERYKKLATVERLAQKLASLGADRGGVIIAFGGGVVGDVVGLLASLYMRGLDVVQVPTTVLAQADASIGGKTGVNLRAGKNLLGTFHQPRLVLIDPAVLSTLPQREFRAGLFEILKCGVIGRPALFQRLEKVEVRQLRRDPEMLQWVIAEAVKLKAEIVSADEREGGLRRVLNFGHTIGHALEAESGYRRFLHGEAVAWGMIAAAHLAAGLEQCDRPTASRITERTLTLAPLPKVTARSRDILRLLQSDKKTRNGVVHFVLPREIGKVEIVNDVPESAVLAAVDELRRLSGHSQPYRAQRIRRS
jgi:3-dehydroquinate synthase